MSDELIPRLLESAATSLKMAGEIPPSIVGVTIGWRIEKDPNDIDGRDGIRVIWRVCFDKAPTEDDLEFVSSSTEFLVSDIWRRLIWVEEEVRVVSAESELPALSLWLYKRAASNNSLQARRP